MNCDPQRAFLAVAEEGVIVNGFPAKLELAAGLDDGQRLLALVDDAERALTQIDPERLAILLPEASGRGSSHARLAPRIIIETLVRTAAAKRTIPLEMMSRPRLRSKLGLPRKGSLDQYLDAAGDPIGSYWTAGRGLAALAALAAGRD